MQFQPKESWRQTVEFWRETKSEVRKVSWPASREVAGTTTVVIVAVIIIGVYLWLCDLVFYKAIDLLFTRFGTGA